jgi:hypothetical protein
MTEQEHIKRHKELHTSLDELVADWITNNPGHPLPGKATVIELMEWSHQQTIYPTPNKYPQ